jgi:hypothetical protein
MNSRIKCGLCSHEAYDLTSHVINFHKITTAEYRNNYGLLVSSRVEEKRRETCLLRHGDENYKNREAIKLSNELFEGGHSLKDPTVREKAKNSKEILYGDPTFTNREKAKKTSLEKYGTEYTCAAPGVIKKRLDTLKSRYGRVFNIDRPHNKTDAPSDFEEEYMRGTPMGKLSQMFGVSEPVIGRWVKDANLERSYVEKSERVIETPSKIVSEYFQECLTQNKVLSFYEYGKIRGNNYTLKMKRLFNAGKKFSHLKEELFRVALDVLTQDNFLEKIASEALS